MRCVHIHVQVRVFDIGQVPTDMTRYTEGGMRMFGTLLLDDKNKIRSEPVDSLFTEIYMNELQVSNIEQVNVCKCFYSFHFLALLCIFIHKYSLHAT